MSTIRLHSCRDMELGNKIQAIKNLRDAADLGLKEAKDACEGMPCNIEVPGYKDLHSITRKLNSYGFTHSVVSGEDAPEFTGTSEIAFRNFLVALIHEGQYDKVMVFIKTHKQGTVGGAPTRNLEVLEK